MENFVKKYLKYLDHPGKHLSYETISTYINLYHNLSGKEESLIKEHLDSCTECNEKFNEVFDEDFEFDDKTISLKFQQVKVDENKKIYQSDEGNIEILFSRENLKTSLKFIHLPGTFINQNFRIVTSSNVLRILSAEENKSYFLNQNIDLEAIREINAAVLQVYKPDMISSFSGINKYYIFAAAATIIIALFVIGYFYFAPVKQKVITINKNKTETDSILYEKKEIVNQEIQKESGGKNKKSFAENNFNEEDFKNNTVLQNFVNRNIRSETDIEIISPRVGDTLKNKIELKWNSGLQGINYHIIVVNNRDEKAWEIVTSNKRTTINKKLQPGLYYWKIEADEKLETVGKFFIK